MKTKYHYFDTITDLGWGLPRRCATEAEKMKKSWKEKEKL